MRKNWLVLALLSAAACGAWALWPDGAAAQARYGPGVGYVTFGSQYGPYVIRSSVSYDGYMIPHYHPPYNPNPIIYPNHSMLYSQGWHDPSIASYGRPERGYYLSNPQYFNGNGKDAPARLQVRLPAPDAMVWFGESRTTQTGLVREFESPVLTAGRTYTYDIKARWTEGGKEIEQTQSVSVQAGQGVAVVFPVPKKDGEPKKNGEPKK